MCSSVRLWVCMRERSKRKFMMIEKCVLCYSSVTRSVACAPLLLPVRIIHMSATLFFSFSFSLPRYVNKCKHIKIHSFNSSDSNTGECEFLMLFKLLCGLWSFASLSSNVLTVYLHIAFAVSVSVVSFFFTFFLR